MGNHGEVRVQVETPFQCGMGTPVVKKISRGVYVHALTEGGTEFCTYGVTEPELRKILEELGHKLKAAVVVLETGDE